MDMLKKVKAWIDKHNLLPQGSSVVVACSGGPDSLVLVHMLSRLIKDYDLSLAAAHVDHMFRGKEAQADAQFVAAFCRQLGLRCYQTAIDVPRYMEENGLSAEEAARIVRYSYLRKVANKLGGALIATGHHRDDQAETVLMHLLRGSGGEGLGGMKAQNGDIIRPLLALNRQEIEAYCAQYKWQPRLDSTNLSTEYLRNDLRLNLLPQLRRTYNPAITDALCRTAEIIGDEHDLVRQAAEAAWPEIVNIKESGAWSIKVAGLARLHIAVQRELFRQIIEKKQGHLKGITFLHVEKLIQLGIFGQTGSIIELPGGCIFRKEYASLIVETGGIRTKARIGPPGIRLTVPGITHLPDGRRLEARLVEARPVKKAAAAIFDWQQLKAPLYVRTRCAGDRFHPLGMRGSKKVKDFFIDAKVPQRARDETLIFCDAQEIIWLGGYRQAEYGKVTSSTKEFLEIAIKQ
jgi:tRNA(Ile)-lysidine synthase